MNLLDEEATIGDVWYKAEISQDVFADKRASEGLWRRLHTVKPTRTIPGDFTTLVRDREGVTRAAAKELGIAERFIVRIFRQIVSFSISTKKRKLACLAEELGVDDDIEIVEPVKRPSTPRVPEKHEPPAKKPEGATNKEMIVLDGNEVTPLSPVRESPTRKPEGTHNQEIVNPKESVVMPEKPLSPIHETLEKNTEEHRGNTETEPETEQHTPMEHGKHHSKTIKERARDLLITGVMPLLPPARAEWEGIDPIELVRKDTVTIYWPPKEWNRMKEDEKLTSWMFTAMALEYDRGVALVKESGPLLDRYAFLALPGTTVPKTDKNPDAMVRLGNYNVLKEICLGNTTDDEALAWLDVFEAAFSGADKTIQKYLMKMSHVPLRLTTDNQETQ